MKLKKVYEDETLQRCYEAGLDYKINGANIKNCNFTALAQLRILL